MAEGRGFAAGLAGGLEKIALREQAEEESRAKQALAQQEASRKAISDAVDNVRTVRDQSFEMAGGINEQLVELSKVGGLDPELAAQLRASRDSIIAEYAGVMQEVRSLMASDPNVDPTLLASMGRGDQILQMKRQQYDAAILGAFAESPEVLGRSEAIQKVKAYETAVGRTASPLEIKRLFGTDKDPRVVNFIGPDGQRASVDMTAPGAAAEVKRLTNAGYWTFSGQLQGQDLDAFVDKGDRKDFDAFQKNTIKLMAETARLRQQAFEGEPVYTGLVGNVLGGLNTVMSQYKQFGDFMGGGVEDDLLDANGGLTFESMNFSRVFEQMEESGVSDQVLAAAKSSRAFRFNLFGLAFMLARLEDPNDRLSAQEVQFQIDRLGSGELSTLGSILDEVDRKAAVALDAELQVRELNPKFDQSQVVPMLRTVVNNYRSGLSTQETKDPVQALLSEATGDTLSPEWLERYRSLPEAQQKQVWTELRKRQAGGK